MKTKKLMVFALCIALCAASAATLSGCNNAGQEHPPSAVSSQQEKNETANKLINEEDISEEQSDSSNENSEESVDDIALMSETEKYISELTGSDEYKELDVSEKKKKVLELLEELIEKGLVEKDSVTESDDMIGFQYKSGILGGVKLTEWSSDMNNIDSADPSSESKTESSAKTLETKTLADFRTTATRSTKTSQSLFENYFTKLYTQDNVHCKITMFGKLASDNSTATISYEYQNQDKKKYIAVSTDSNELSDYFMNQKIIIKDGITYTMVGNQKTCYTIVSSNQQTDLSDDFDFGHDIQNLTEWGTCEYDGKTMDYELYDDDGVITAAYFYNNAFYTAEIYQAVASSATNTNNPSDTDYLLQETMTADFSLKIDASLFEIPDDYELIPQEIYDPSEPEIPEN